MVLPPGTAATQDRIHPQRGRAKRQIGSKARPRQTTRVALPLPEPPPKGADVPIDILPPVRHATVRRSSPALRVPGSFGVRRPSPGVGRTGG